MNDELDDDFEHDEPIKRKPYSCADRMCGALDCLTCHPEGEVNESEMEDES